MYSALLLRLGSQVLSATMGGMAVFCLYYAAKVSSPDVVRWLLVNAFIWGGVATGIVYFQGKYLR
jgi:hypothetical protein